MTDLANVLYDHAGVEEDDEIRGSVTSAQDATETRMCKRDSCDLEEQDSRGRYAGLCPKHKQLAREEAAREREAEATGGERKPVAPPVSPSPATAGVDMVSLVDALRKPARRFERALAAKKATKDEAVEALTEFSAALNALKTAAQSKIEEAR